MNNQAICLFDSSCILCNGSVRRILKYEKAPTIKFVAIPSSTGQKLAQDHGIDPDSPETFLFIENDSAQRKSDAAIAVSRHLRGMPSLLGLLRFIPRPMRDFVYDRVAQNRYRWFGQDQECLLPTSENQHRFVL